MTDAHCHLSLPELTDVADQVVSRFRAAGGTYIGNSGPEPVSWQTVLSQARTHPSCLPSLGLHPEMTEPGSDMYIDGITEKWIEAQVEDLSRLLQKHEEIVAVGECGLDYYWVKKERLEGREQMYALQRKMFARCIDLAVEHDLPLVIHCRDESGDKQAEAETIELLVRHGGIKQRILFHSYTGSLSYLEEILGLGGYISFNGIVTYKNADNVRELLDAVPLDRLLLETDAPLLVPNRSRSIGVKICEPAHIQEVAEAVAQRKRIPVARLWTKVDENFGKLYGRDRYPVLKI